MALWELKLPATLGKKNLAAVAVAVGVDAVDAVIQGGEVHIVLGTGKTIPTPLASVNAFLLPDLIPELNARYG